jgi:UDP-N-acetylglucosamine--N-acetylmuramyl-(pentapeptide) pyrophosphoryl-undecaprenol N-acetylglucosamine transferase
MCPDEKSPLRPKESTAPKRCILLAAGGTGGHLIPAQMAARDLLEKNCRVFFAGKGLSKNGIFDREQFAFVDIASATIGLQNPLQLLRSFVLLCKGTWQSLRLFSLLKPDLVVGFGSYHTFPLLLAALWKKIPIAIFQPDRSLGRVNHFFAKKAKVVALQFPLEKKGLPSVAYVPLMPWNILQPLPSKEAARAMLHLEKDLFTLLVFGGSQGAQFINETVLSTIELSKNRQQKLQIIHLTGEVSDRYSSFYQKLSIPAYVRTFEKNMVPLFLASDLAICRAGASSCGELITFDLPYLLIPYPYAKGHQGLNASYMQDTVQGGDLLLQKSVTPEPLFERICQKKQMLSYHKEKIKEFKKERSHLRPKTLCDIICEIVGSPK